MYGLRVSSCVPFCRSLISVVVLLCALFMLAGFARGQDRPESSSPRATESPGRPPPKQAPGSARPSSSSPPPGASPSPGTTWIGLPPGGTFERSSEFESSNGSTSDESSANAKSASASATGNGAIDQKNNFGAPVVGTPGGAHGNGGATNSDQGAKPPPEAATPWYASQWFWLGFILCLIGLALLIVPKLWPIVLPKPIPPKIPLAFMVAGAVLMLVVFAPAFATGLLVAAFVVIATPFVHEAIANSHFDARNEAELKSKDSAIASKASEAERYREAGSAMVTAIGQLPSTARREIEAEIGKHADEETSDHATIAELANANGVSVVIPKDAPKA